jgi:hypothetical protein
VAVGAVNNKQRLCVCVCTFVIVIISRFESSVVRRKDDDDEDLIDFCCWAATMELKYQSALATQLFSHDAIVVVYVSRA